MKLRVCLMVEYFHLLICMQGRNVFVKCEHVTYFHFSCFVTCIPDACVCCGYGNENRARLELKVERGLEVLWRLQQMNKMTKEYLVFFVHFVQSLDLCRNSICNICITTLHSSDSTRGRYVWGYRSTLCICCDSLSRVA